VPEADPRNTGSYTIQEASYYLLVPPATLRSWTFGRSYPTSVGDKFATPLIDVADHESRLLSFWNLVEAYGLSQLTKVHGVPFKNVRRGLEKLMEFDGVSPDTHPLASKKFLTDGRDLLIEHLGQTINLTENGQTEIRETIDVFLSRVSWGTDGYANQWYPYTRDERSEQPKVIVMNPRISFGRPVLVGTGIATDVVAGRFNAGESIQDLARDYGRAADLIEEAVRCELLRTKAKSA